MFRCDGIDVGRFMRTANSRDVWRWTAYGISSGGMKYTIEEAKRQFKETFEGGGRTCGFAKPAALTGAAVRKYDQLAVADVRVTLLWRISKPWFSAIATELRLAMGAC